MGVVGVYLQQPARSITRTLRAGCQFLLVLILSELGCGVRRLSV